MRHRRKKNKLSRSASHRDALIRNLVSDLIRHEKIKTTHKKAKVAQAAFDSLFQITLSDATSQIKKQRLHQFLNNKELENKVLTDLHARYKDRKTGLTRVIRLENRMGDNAPQSQIELV